MSKPILQLQNSANWQLVWGDSRIGLTDAKGNRIPLASFSCPVRIESHTIAIFAQSPNGKQSWNIGGSVARKITTGISGAAGADVNITDAKLFRLNRWNLYRFTPLTTDYELEISPKWWLPDIAVSVHVYTGIDSDSITEQLNRIEQIIDFTQR
jgi:hypothetical protein